MHAHVHRCLGYCYKMVSQMSVTHMTYLLTYTIRHAARHYVTLTSFVRYCGQVSSLVWTTNAETFMSVQCASPGRGGELVGVCGVSARCVGWRKAELGVSSLSGICKFALSRRGLLSS